MGGGPGYGTGTGGVPTEERTERVGVPFIEVDAFTVRLGAGNPAAVCVLSAPADAAWMQAVAWAMRASETAFLTCTPLHGAYEHGAVVGALPHRR